MNLIEHWGSGIPRIIGKVKAAGLREPEFIGGEVDLRINIYRGQSNDAADVDSAEKVPDSASTVPDSTGKVPDSAGKVPETDQEKQIYKVAQKNGRKWMAEKRRCGTKHNLCKQHGRKVTLPSPYSHEKGLLIVGQPLQPSYLLYMQIRAQPCAG